MKLDFSPSAADQISLDEFKRGCKKIKLSKLTDVDECLVYHFLDSSHNCQLSKAEWLSLAYFYPPKVSTKKGKEHQDDLLLRNLFGTKNPEEAYFKLQGYQ